MNIMKLVKVVAKVVGVVKHVTPDDQPVTARKTRVGLSAIIVAWLVDQGLDIGIADALVALVEALVATQ